MQCVCVCVCVVCMLVCVCACLHDFLHVFINVRMHAHARCMHTCLFVYVCYTHARTHARRTHARTDINTDTAHRHKGCQRTAYHSIHSTLGPFLRHIPNVVRICLQCRMSERKGGRETRESEMVTNNMIIMNCC